MAKPELSKIYEKLNGVPNYHPFFTQTFADWSSEAGDTVNIQQDGTTYRAPVHKQSLVWKGKQQISMQSGGKKERDPIERVSNQKTETNAGTSSYRSGYGGMGSAVHQLQYDFYDEEGIYQSQLYMDEQRFTTLFTKTGIDGLGPNETLATKINQTADAITLEAIRAKGEEATLSSKLSVTAESITAEVTRAKTAEGALSGRLDVTAESITAEVTRATTAEGTLDGKITVEAGKITQIVSNIGADGTVTAASICLAINNAGSTATINADKIYLLGETIANKITADYVANKVSLVANLTAQKISADSLTVKPVAGMGAINVATAYNGSSLTLDGNTYTLMLAKMNGSYDSYTFSRATSLSGGWSSGKYTVTASPQGNSVSTTLQNLTPTGSITAIGKTLYRTFRVYHGADSEHVSSTGFSQQISISARDFLQAKTVYDSGTVSPDEGYIGLSSVSVEVPSSPSVAGISVGNIATSTTQPTGYEGATLLSNLANAIKNNRNTYVWFLVKALDGDNHTLYTKAYYCASA